MIEPEPLQQINRTYVSSQNRKLSYFSGCDYFRLASHPQVLKAVTQAIGKYGLNVAASRLTTGNHSAYLDLEKTLARFFQADSATLVSIGYTTNMIVAQALSGNFSHALTDSRSHPSFSDAARFLDCPVMEFKHCSPDDLARCVRRCGPGARLIVLTDGMFAQDGSTAPLDKYLKLLPADAIIVVDDAHGAGVLGQHGRGTLEELRVSRRRIIQTVTLSKAFGAYGGAILGPRALREKIFQRSRLFIASTPLPLPLAYAANRSLGIVRKNPQLRKRLVSNALFVKTSVRKAGFKLELTPGPIVPVLPADKTEAAAIKRQFLKAGIYPPFIKYPGGPAGGFFRFVISSEHTRAQLDSLIKVLLELGKNGAKFAGVE